MVIHSPSLALLLLYRKTFKIFLGFTCIITHVTFCNQVAVIIFLRRLFVKDSSKLVSGHFNAPGPIVLPRLNFQTFDVCQILPASISRYPVELCDNSSKVNSIAIDPISNLSRPCSIKSKPFNRFDVTPVKPTISYLLEILTRERKHKRKVSRRKSTSKLKNHDYQRCRASSDICIGMNSANHSIESSAGECEELLDVIDDSDIRAAAAARAAEEEGSLSPHATYRAHEAELSNSDNKCSIKSTSRSCLSGSFRKTKSPCVKLQRKPYFSFCLLGFHFLLMFILNNVLGLSLEYMFGCMISTLYLSNSCSDAPSTERHRKCKGSAEDSHCVTFSYIIEHEKLTDLRSDCLFYLALDVPSFYFWIEISFHWWKDAVS